MKTGLVLEGGGMRGIYTAGVLDVFLDNGITFDAVVGVSAGAIYATSFLSGQRGRSLRYYKKYCKDKNFMGLWSWITTGDFVNKDFCYNRLPNELDILDYDAFRKNPTEFYVVCANVDTVEAEYIRVDDLEKQTEYLRATASLPFLSKIVEIDGKKYLDGGIIDSIPAAHFLKEGYDRIVVVQTQVKEYRKKPSRHTGVRWMLRKYPKLLAAIDRRSDVYNQTMEHIFDLEEQGRVLCIRPSKCLGLARLEKDAEKLQKQYELGCADALRMLDRIKAYLTQ